MLKKTLALFLALLMLTAVFAGCGTKKTNVGGDTTGTKASTTAKVTEDVEEDNVDQELEDTDEDPDANGDDDTRETVAKDTIDFTANPDISVDTDSIYEELTIEQLLTPELFEGSDIPESRDYGGYEFNLLADTVCSPYEFMSDSDGELIKDAVANRQNYIEEYLGIKFVLTEMYGGYNDMEGFAAEIESASGAGTPYDMALAYNLIPPVVAAKGLSRDLAESDNLNLYDTTKEYWGKEIKQEIMVGGRIFWMSDNSSWNNIRNMLCIFVNLDYFSRINTEMDKNDLYQMVYNGVWTFDNMLMLAQNSYENTNMGDEKTDGVDDGDSFGLQAAETSPWLDTWLYAAGFRYTKLNYKGTYDWTLGDQPVIDFIDWWQAQLKDDDVDEADTNQYKMFSDGRAMFALSGIKILDESPYEINCDFTVLPMPLYNPAVKNNYSTPFSNTYSSWLIPKAAKTEAFERSATVLEMLAAEGNRRLAPVYFEIYLKRQVAMDDPDMRRMFNLVRNCIVFDMGYLYGSVLKYDQNGDNPGEVFLAVRRVWAGDGTGFHSNITTVWASIGRSVTTKLNNLMVDILDY